ncbi:glutathione S-transferase family protein [Phenylobacterium sp.]|uniref:glutathione S-transferase family protein n=1 Tax=Phenylobacterium sp. TaxID=1871053 RepID=UPI002FCA21B1
MEPILVYGFPLGSATGLVAAFEWLGQPYRLCRVDMLKDMKNDDYRRLNGRAETPVLITDDSRVLTETMAIAQWLEVRDTERRISFAPGTPEADRMHQFIAFVNTGFTGAFSPLWAALEMDPPNPSVQEPLRAVGRKMAADRHGQLEAMIGDTPFLVGGRPTLADGVFAGVARWAEFHGAPDLSAYPKLSAVRRRIESDPAFAFAVAIEDGETPTGSGAMTGQVPLADVIARFAG